MIDIFFTPYPDEILYSWIVRYCSISGNYNYYSTIRELFEVKDIRFNIHFSNYLDRLSYNIPEELKVTPEKLIYNNTMFPFFSPFLYRDRQTEAIRCMREGNKNYIYKMGYSSTRGISISNSNYTVKYCPLCYDEEIQNNEEAYIHRIHQVPGNEVCIKHKIYLNEIKLTDSIELKRLIDINKIDVDKKVKKIESNLENYYINLSRDIEFVLNGGIANFEVTQIYEKYNCRLDELDYRAGRIKYAKLNADFLNYYSTDFLKRLNLNFDVDDRKHWIYSVIIPHKQRVINPLKHLLLIRFLFGDIQELINYKIPNNPFGEPPYICLNRIADHYGKAVVNNYTLDYVNPNKTPRITIKCSCGFTYVKLGGYKSEEDKYKVGMIKEYGDLWDNKLRENINKKKHSLNKLAKLMHCSKCTIKRQVVRLGLINEIEGNVNFDEIINTNLERQSKKQKSSDYKLEQYKHNIVEYVRANKNVDRKTVRENLPTEYCYVIMRDKLWIDSTVKSTKKSIKDYSAFWKSKDKEVSDKIIELVNYILNNNIDVRITKRYISKKINYVGILTSKYKKWLPISNKILDDVCETSEQFKNRKENGRHYCKEPYNGAGKLE